MGSVLLFLLLCLLCSCCEIFLGHAVVTLMLWFLQSSLMSLLRFNKLEHVRGNCKISVRRVACACSMHVHIWEFNALEHTLSTLSTLSTHTLSTHLHTRTGSKRGKYCNVPWESWTKNAVFLAQQVFIAHRYTRTLAHAQFWTQGNVNVVSVEMNALIDVTDSFYIGSGDIESDVLLNVKVDALKRVGSLQMGVCKVQICFLRARVLVHNEMGYIQ